MNVSKEEWSVSGDSERFDGAYSSKEEAIAEGRSMYPDRSFWIGRNSPPTQPEDLWEARDWLEHVSVQDDYAGEWAEDWDDSNDEQIAELEAEVRKVMAAWLDRHDLRPRFFNIDQMERISVDEGLPTDHAQETE